MNTKAGTQVSLSDDQWNLLFLECCNSGLTIKEWCGQHKINYHRFFYHRRRLQKHTGEKTSDTIHQTTEPQEVVDISSNMLLPPCQVTEPLHAPDVGVRLTFHGIPVEIMNSAAGDCIRDTLSVLRELCQEICPVCRKSISSQAGLICVRVSMA